MPGPAAQAAARRWDARWEECDTAEGFVTSGRRRLRFGELAGAAAAGRMVASAADAGISVAGADARA